ncbi:hypothetical protein PSPO01_16350 [Paraphaeosphaeria sporulosa]
MAAGANSRNVEQSTSPSSPTRSRPTSPSPSNASSHRTASPTPSDASQPYRTIASHRETFPTTWNHNISPKRLATSGFIYFGENEHGEDTCECNICDESITVTDVEDVTINDLLGLHSPECLLADILFNLINHMRTRTAPAATPQTPPTPVMPSPPSSHPPPSKQASSRSSSPRECSPRPPSPRPPQPCPTQIPVPPRPSYAAVAASPSPKGDRNPSPPPPPHQQRPSYPPPSASKPPTMKAPSTPVATSRTPTTAPPRRRSPYTSSPVLSIHDLERRFQNKPSPFYNQYHRQSLGRPHASAVAQLLHAIAELLGSYGCGHDSVRIGS